MPFRFVVQPNCALPCLVTRLGAEVMGSFHVDVDLRRPRSQRRSHGCCQLDFPASPTISQSGSPSLHPLAACARVVRELVGLSRILQFGTTVLYLRNCLMCWRTIVNSRKLYCADAILKDRVLIYYHGIRFIVDCGSLDSMLPGDSATFSTIREMFGRDVYLRAFDTRQMRLTSVVDAGGNRGLFSLWAASAGANTYWIESQAHYLRVARFLWAQNGVSNRVCPVVASLGGATPGNSVSVGDVIAKIAVPVSLLKIDIEGAEFQMFATHSQWLSQVENLAMEVHRWAGRPAEIVDVLRNTGFELKTTNDRFHPVAPAQATYIYASSVGALND